MMTQQVQEAATVSAAQVLARLAELCIDGLPVPVSTQITSGPCGVWLTLHMAHESEVNTWASRLGVLPDLDEHVYTTSRRWRAYRFDVQDGQAEACWAPGVTQVRVWASVDCDDIDRLTECPEGAPV